MNALPGHGAALWLLLAGWVVLLALLPWWLGLGLLVLLGVGTGYYARRSAHLADVCGRGLKWGLPGVLFAVQRALGGDLVAWGAALLGALVGFSLVALLESFLGRRGVTAVAPRPAPEWKELAMAPIGPLAHIIELIPPTWHQAGASQPDPLGGVLRFEARAQDRGTYLFADGVAWDGLSPRYASSPAGRWFIADLPGGEGNFVADRRSRKSWRLRHWQLHGWEGESPWFSRQSDGVPAPLHEVLGQDGS